VATAAAARSALEKKSLNAEERNTEANRKRRAEFVESIRVIPPERLIHLDINCVTAQMTRLNTRCADGSHSLSYA
jgi:hypothetical protein